MTIGYLLLILLAYTEFSSAAVIGIDLGSSSFKLVLVQRDFQVILNEQSARKTPTAVAFRDGERSIGSAAENVARFNPSMSYTLIRDLLGKSSLSDPSVEHVSNYIFYLDALVEETAALLNGTEIDYRYLAVKQNETHSFAVHELMGMIFQYAKKLAEKSAGGSIKDCTITVPVFWTQKERQTLVDTANLAGLNVLSLINEGTAYALKYAIDRTSTETENVVFVDLGESSLQLTLVNFSSVDGKDKKKVPQVRIVGTSWDNQLGARDFDHRLLKHFLNQIKETHKKDLSNNPRAMLKLLTELKRTREVLSANKEKQVIIEELTDSFDYFGKLNREEFETICADLFAKIPAAIDQLLASAGLTKSDISSIEMVGGAVRIPKVQEIVKTHLGRDQLGFHINADEGAVFGAAFFAAGISAQHRVKEIRVRDSTPFKVAVNVTGVEESITESDSENKSEDKHAVLFRPGNRLGSKKTLSFHTENPFSIQLRYENESSEEYVNQLPPGTDLLIEEYNIFGLPSKDNYNFTGKPKVHLQFQISLSGIVELTKAEAEITVTEIVKKKLIPLNTTKEETTQTKDEENSNKSTEKSEENTEETKENTEETKENNEESEEKSGEDAEKSTENESGETIQKTEENEKPESEPEQKIEEIIELEEVKKSKKITLKYTSTQRTRIPHSVTKKAKKTLDEIDEIEKIRFATANAKNDLESFIYDTKGKLDSDEFMKASTAEERDVLESVLNKAALWLEDEGYNAKLNDFLTKKDEAIKASKPIFFRIADEIARPEALNTCLQTLNFSKIILSNITKTHEVEQNEVDEFTKKADDLLAWLTEKISEQIKLEPHVDPIITAEQINNKCKDVYIKAQYLSKRSRRKPPKPAKKPTESDAKDTKDKKEETKNEENKESNEDANEETNEDTNQETNQETNENVEGNEENIGNENVEENEEPKQEL